MWEVTRDGDLYYGGSCLAISRNLSNTRDFSVYSQYLIAKQPKPKPELLQWMEDALSIQVDRFLVKYWQHATGGSDATSQ